MIKGLVAAALAAVLGGGCAQLRSSDGRNDVSPQVEQLAEAQTLQRESRFGEALDAYRKIQQEHPGSDWAAAAKYSAALILVSPDYSRRDYGQALNEFDEFISQFPQHRRAPEARSWRQVLKMTLDVKKENERLSKSIEMLKQLDVKQEEKRMGR
jgi:outer membrane protein assembly factor BamD (BamD/ComL family)